MMAASGRRPQIPQWYYGQGRWIPRNDLDPLLPINSLQPVTDREEYLSRGEIPQGSIHMQSKLGPKAECEWMRRQKIEPPWVYVMVFEYGPI